MKRPIPSIDDERTRENALGILRTGGVVVLPTDTLYGFSAKMSADAAIRRIAEAKDSGTSRRYIFLASSIEMVGRYVRWQGDAIRSELDRIWPAPLTAILPAGGECPPWAGESIAFRVPALPLLLDLIAQLGEPIVSTSVNRSGESPLTGIEDILDAFGTSVDLLVSGDEKADQAGGASTLVDFTGESPLVLRTGDYAWDRGGGNPSK